MLAGGYGTRLKPLTCTKPRPMLPSAGKPILRFIVETVAREGFSDVIVTTNHFREQIIERQPRGFATEKMSGGIVMTLPRTRRLPSIPVVLFTGGSLSFIFPAVSIFSSPARPQTLYNHET